jgi:hypothetical protein
MHYPRRKAFLAVMLAGTVVVGAIGQDYEVSRSTVDGGGVMASDGGSFELSGTIGQPDAGTLSGGNFSVTGGFWFPLAPADCNIDGAVDLYDYDSFEACMSGPSGGLLDPSCVCFDLDGDVDVDLEDVGAFQLSFGS